jgi:hypothetical protein
MEKEKSTQQTYQIEENRPILDNELAEIQGAPNDEEYWEEEQRKSNEKAIFIGAICLIGGFVLSISGVGYVFYGLMIYGVIQLFRGFGGVA